MTATLSSGPAAGGGSTLLRFARWWGGERAGLMPGALRRAVGLESLELLVLAQADDLRLRRRRVGGLEDLGGLEALPTAAGDARIVLQIPAERAFVKTVQLPLAAAENLPEVLAFEMDRQTPFQPDQVHFGYSMLDRDTAEKTLRARLSVVPRTVVADALKRLRARGLSPDAIEILDADRLIDVPGGARAAPGIGRLNGLLMVLCLLLLAAAIASPAAVRHYRIAGMEREIAVLKPRAEVALARRGDVDRRTEGAVRAVAARAAAPFATGVLEEVTRLLPDDTWLAQLNIVSGRVEIEGSTASATNLVPLLEGSPRFAAVSFRAPLTTNAVTRREHFQFVIELAPR